MAARILDNIAWYVDSAAKGKGEPGLYNTYMASLATALDYVGDKVDPAWLMGTSAFAFRTLVNEVMCPSAMSVFSWEPILPETVEQASRCCIYIGDVSGDRATREEKTAKAHQEIRKAIDRGVPPIVWDLQIPEWGLIIGYDDGTRNYSTLTGHEEIGTTPFDSLGQKNVKLLSVAILGEPNSRSREQIILSSLRTAVRHAEQKEWQDRPKYIDGPAAYDLWASIIEPGKNDKTNFGFAKYYAGHYFAARAYARDYLSQIADGNETLLKAASAYGRAASFLKPAWHRFSAEEKPSDDVLASLAQSIRKAKTAEEEGIALVREYLEEHKG